MTAIEAQTKTRKRLQKRFFVFSLLLSLAVILITSGVTLSNTMSTFADSSRQYLSTYISYADQVCTERLSSAKVLAHTIAGDQRIVQAAIVQDNEEASYSWFMDQVRIRGFLDSLIAGKDYIRNAAVVLSRGTIWQSSGSMRMNRDLIQALEQESLNVTFRNDGTCQIIRPLYTKNERCGAVFLELDTEKLFSEYSIVPLEPASIYILDDTRTVLFHRGETLGDLDLEWLATQNSGFSYEAGRLLFLLKQPGQSGEMTVFAFVTPEQLLGNAIRVGRWTVILSIMAVVFSSLAAQLFGKSLFANLNALMESMKAVARGDFSARAVLTRQDEIVEAAEVFNATMDRINLQMEEIRQQEKAKRSAEMKVLEAQIQPHFIYNSISAMQYAAGMRGQTDIEEAAKALGTLMRSVLGNHNAWISLWEERSYIEQYIVLQRFKYANTFSMRWEVDETLWAFMIPKLLLQPLVENALLHGLQNRQHGEIVVSASVNGPDVLLRVSDNGTGMDAGQIQQLMDAAYKPVSMRHVGISNVLERIRQSFGDEASFEILSVPGSFTTIELKLPLNRKDSDDEPARSDRG